MSDTALVVMARYPAVGKTKTRLAQTIGHGEAARLYQAFLTDLAQRFAQGACDLHWAYTPAEVDYPAFVATLAPSRTQHMRCFPQHGSGNSSADQHSVCHSPAHLPLVYHSTVAPDSHAGRSIMDG